MSAQTDATSLSDAAPAPLDVSDLVDATDALDVVDAADASDVIDAGDVIDAADVIDAGDAGLAHAGSSAHDALPRTTGAIARVTLGLILMLALALVAGSERVRAWERGHGLAMVTGSGLPFLLLGVLARRPEIAILTDEVLTDLTPLLEFGLGWIGFRVGTDFNVRHIDHWPRGTVRVMVIESACAFLAVVVVSGLVLGGVAGMSGTGFVRNAVILGACAAVSAPTGARMLAAVGVFDRHAARHLRKVASLDDVMALMVVAVVTAVFRPVDSGAWRLPPMGWLFLQVGMGVGLGVLVVAAVRSATSALEDVAMTLGALAFAAGMAGYVGFSPLVVCFVAGVMVTNLPPEEREASWLSRPRFRALERPIFMAFFVVVGALWNPTDHRGWAVVPLFVAARLGGKLLGVRAAFAAQRLDKAAPNANQGSVLRLTNPRATWWALVPTSAVSIAVVVSARQSYPGSMRGSLETVVIAGALLSEVIFRLGARRVAGGRVSADESFGALTIGRDPDDAEPSIPPEPKADR